MLQGCRAEGEAVLSLGVDRATGAHTYLLKYSTSRSVSSISTPSVSLGRNTSSRKTQPGGLSAHSQASGSVLPTHEDCPPPHGLPGGRGQPLFLLHSPKEEADFSCLLRLRRLRPLACGKLCGLAGPGCCTDSCSEGCALASPGQLRHELPFSLSPLGLPAQPGPGRLPRLPSPASAQLPTLGGSVALASCLGLGVWPLTLGASRLAKGRGAGLASLFLA